MDSETLYLLQRGNSNFYAINNVVGPTLATNQSALTTLITTNVPFSGVYRIESVVTIGMTSGSGLNSCAAQINVNGSSTGVTAGSFNVYTPQFSGNNTYITAVALGTYSCVQGTQYQFQISIAAGSAPPTLYITNIVMDVTFVSR